MKEPSFRVLVALGVVLLGAFGSMSGSLLWQARQEARASAGQAATSMVGALADEVTRTIEINTLAMRDTADALLRPELQTASPELRHLMLFSAVSTARFMGNAFVVDAAGRVTDFSQVGRTPNLPVLTREYYLYHRDHPADEALHVSHPFASAITGEQSVALSQAVHDGQGRLVGIVVCIVHVSYFENLFERVDLGPHGSLALFFDDGTMLMRKPFDPALIGSNIGHSARTGPGRSGRYETHSAVDGIWRTYYYEKIVNAPLVMYVGMSDLDALAAWSARTVALGIAFGVLLVAGVFVIRLLRREIARRGDAERRSAQSEAQFRMLAENSVDSVVLRDLDGMRLYASPSFYEMIGWPREVIGHRRLSEFMHADDRHIPQQTLTVLAAGAESVTEMFRCHRQDGAWIWIESRASAVRDPDGAVTGVIANLRDVTSRKVAEDELTAVAQRYAVLATVDKLTGVANRRRFDEVLEHEWRRAQRNHAALSLLMIDADQFKGYNDRYGHQRGDAVLQAIATCIVENVRRPGDLGARYGGEEFAVLLPETNERQAQMAAERIRAAVEALAIAHQAAAGGCVTVSVGVACVVPGEAAEPASLVSQADAALYHAKRCGRNRCVTWTAMADVPGVRGVRIVAA